MKPAVLVTTDLSPGAAVALPLARRLGQALDLPTELLHVVHAPVLLPAFTRAPELDAQDAEERLRETIAALGPGSPVRAEVRLANNVVEAIVARAVELDAPFLVVAGSGKSGWQRLRLGSTVHALLRHLARPIVCVPATSTPPRAAGGRLLVTSDLSDLSRRALAPSAALARALGMPLTLVAVSSGPAEEVDAWGRALRGLAADLASTGLDAQAEVIGASAVPAAIIERASAPDVAMLCMASHGRSGFKRLLLGSVVEAVLPGSPVPVAVFPAA